MRALLALAAAVGLAAALPSAAGAVPIVLSDETTLTTADTNTLPTPSAPVTVTGMQPGEKLVGIDQRPSTGQLYGIGDTSRMYTLDPSTGVATQVGAAGSFTLNGNWFGTDFNPVTDLVRVVSQNEQNLRLNPNSGALFSEDTGLNPAGNVVAAAYTNNVSGATTTTLFDIDSASGRLLRQGGADGAPPSPNGGSLQDVGPLMVSPLLDAIGFDIGADGVALATITTAGSVTKLYGINTSSGQATDLGTIGSGTTPYSGLAIMPARIRLSSATVSASEGGSALFEVTRNAPAAGPVTVEYATAAGTAGAGEDFTPTSGTVAWGAGESGTKTIAVPVTADSAAEGDETFTVTLSNITGSDAVFGAPTTATATIAANEAGPTLQFDPASVSVVEGGSASLSVTRVGSTTQPVSVEYTTAPGSAGETDYTPLNGTLSWAAGDGAPKTISVPITNDTGREGAETFGVNLVNPAGGAVLGSPAAATVTIAASDQPRKPTLALGGAKKQKLSTVRRKGVAVTAKASLACKLKAVVKRGKKTVGSKTKSLKKGKKTSLRIKVKKSQRSRLRAKQKLRVSATCTAGSAKSAKKSRTITLKR